MIVVDLEMTGVSPAKHSIVSIGAVDMNNPKRQFYTECRVERWAEIDPESLLVAGFSVKEVKSKKRKSVKTAVQEFFSWATNLKDCVMVSQNCYDWVFLLAAAERYYLKWPFGHRMVDIHSVFIAELARHKKPLRIKNKVSAVGFTSVILPYVGLPQNPKPPNALNDAQIEAEVLYRLLYGKNLLKVFRQYRVPTVLKK